MRKLATMLSSMVLGASIFSGGLSTPSWAVCSCQSAGPGPHASWVQRFPAHAPPGRWHRLLAYDSDRRVAVTFGGADNCPNRNGTNETWEFDGADWRQINTAHSPPPRYYGGMAYDSHRGVMVLFGGFAAYYGPAYNDTWEYDGTDWRQITPIVSPPACVRFSIAYDPVRQRTVARGQIGENHGDNECGIAQQTWEYDGTTWTLINTANQPPDNNHSSWHTYIAWSAAQTRLLYFLDNAIWTYDGDWHPVETFNCDIEGYGVDDGRGTSLFSPMIDADSSRDFSVTYEWGGPGTCPTTLQHGVYPPSRGSSPEDTVYFAARGSILLFGGAIYCSSQTFSDTWEYLLDSDGDGVADSIDCVPQDPTVYPGAPQLCDGKNNDCGDPNWPTVAPSELDGDGDGYRVCGGDCDDSNLSVHPGAAETCNGLDDNCNGSVDDDLAGVDSDGDGVPNACDNCPTVSNPDQSDTDDDGGGDACDGGGYALNFDGVNDFARVPNSPAFRPGTGSWTVEGWVLLRGFSGVDVIAMCADGDFANGWRLDVETSGDAGSGFTFTVDGGGRITIGSGTLPTVGRWHHVAGVYDSAAHLAYLYVDGNLTNSGGGGVTSMTPSAPLVFGRYVQTCCGTHWLNGELDEVRIWSVARSQDEIRSAMNECLSGLELGLAGYWRFDEGSGQAITDSSANHNDGVLGMEASPAGDDPSRVASGVPLSCIDSDGDSLPDLDDNCVNVPNPDQLDTDHDGLGNACDNCPTAPNSSQVDVDQDGYGSACDCNDSNPDVHPGATEICNDIDDDCDGGVDPGCGGICSQPPQGIISWWTGDSDSADLSGLNNGTLNGDAGICPGLVRQAFCLDGTGDFIDMGTAPSLGSNSLTLAAWIRRAGPGSGSWPNLNVIVGRASLLGGYTTDGPYLRWYYGQAQLILNGGAGDIRSSSVLQDGIWYHLVGTVDAATGQMRLYVNGVLEASGSLPGGIVPNSVPWRIGASSYGGSEESFDGLIDEVQIFDHALTSSEVASICGSGSAGACHCLDHDGDGYGVPGGLDCSLGTTVDCNDADPTIHPGAADVACNGADDNCSGSADEGYVPVPTNCGIGACTATGHTYCSGGIVQDDCTPGAPVPERCNQVDDDCNGLVDDNSAGLDSDGDGVHNACDNCPTVYNGDQIDSDRDGVGNACDNCILAANLDQRDTDHDGLGDVCDNCPRDVNPSQGDLDQDGVGDACDNCILNYNSGQGDFNHDGVGDICDLNDGLILLLFTDSNYIEWQQESGPASWNVYEGDLDVLRATAVYTQAPGSNPLADRHCGVLDTYVEDFEVPAAGKVKFALVTGITGGIEGSLGTNSVGVERPNSNPCP